MDSSEMKRIIARYLRFDLGCPILGIEIASSLATSYNDGGSADVLAVDKKGYLIEVEVKVSIADFKADRKKGKHEYYRKLCGLPYKNQRVRFGKLEVIEPKNYPTHHFYFAVPNEIANKAKMICDNLYPYAGLLTNHSDWYGNISVKKKPTVLAQNKLTLLQATRLAKGQSATLVRLLDDIAYLKNNK